MNETALLKRRLAVVELRVRLLTVAAAVLGVAFLLAAAPPQEDVLRARGLVITDAAGRERVVLGAPMVNASRDGKLAETVGLAVLDSVGRLHVAVGSNTPLVFAGGQMGKRIAAEAGITIYDPRNGGERGGMGAFTDGRANVCLDYGDKPKEAACISVAPGDQYAAVLLNGTPREQDYDRVAMFVGADGGGSIKVFGGGGNRGGVMMRAGKGPASVTVYDSTQQAIGDLVSRR